MQPGVNDGQRNDALHASEISHSDWCPRAAYFRLAGVKPNKEPPVTHWQMRMIWDEGTEIHKKWQSRIWAIGRLSGVFYCSNCRWSWWATSPDECEKCHATKEFLRYNEVPLYDPNLILAGHADGLDGDAVIEIKSIGINSLRFEAPDLINQHSHKFNINGKNKEFLDYDGIWDAIRIPFATHIRQGDLYCYMGGYSTVIFLYECKWNQKCKEMIVKHRPERIESRLEQCRDIRWALEGRKIPDCPFGGCADCDRYEETDVRPTRKLNLHRPPPQAQTPPGPAPNTAGDGERPPPRRLQRLGDTGA